MRESSKLVAGGWRQALRCAAIGFLAVATASSLAAQDSGIPVGTKAPPAVAETLDGKPANLDAWIGKEPVFIEFWATWCAQCKQLEPQVLALQKQYAGKVRFVHVAISANQTVELVKRYVAAHGLHGEQLYDRKGFATDAYEVPTTSFVVVVNAKGSVVYTGTGGKQNLGAAIAKAF
jgi:thiol-disulfide isomerase/thioredoxin